VALLHRAENGQGTTSPFRHHRPQTPDVARPWPDPQTATLSSLRRQPQRPSDPERHPFGSHTNRSTNHHLRRMKKILRALRRTVRSVIPFGSFCHTFFWEMGRRIACPTLILFSWEQRA